MLPIMNFLMTGKSKEESNVERALALNDPAHDDPIDVLIKVGSFEIASLVGAIMGAAVSRIPVVVDGFISGADALLAKRLKPEVKAFMIASHQSTEIGYRVILEALGLQPLFDLGMCLGEGSGSVLAMHLIEVAAPILAEMAIVSEAGVSGRI